ncbi:MAG: SMP-30/gluconolactonase/LRE family protein [Planctomycetaceae bacterium]|nr:SMP-30/gluconolactonase/LRE family protein [Planctomycetaceae bacterium]
MSLRIALFFVAVSCFAANPATSVAASDAPEMQTPKLFVSLPDYCPTPDGMEIDRDGNLVVACPNYADKTKPACIIKIDVQGKVQKWFNVPTIPETGWASPMGLAFGPDGELFICDNQGWMGTPEGQFKGRLLGCRVEGMGDNAKITTRVIADGIEHPNGVRYHNGKLYVTNSLMTKVEDGSGLLVSGVYCFDPSLETTVTVTNTKQDPNLVLSVLTYNKECQYGLDGIAFGPDGAMYLGNFGDGTVLRVELDDQGKVVSCETWAKDLKNLRTTDGICFDDNGNLYIADFSENAIAVVKPDSRVYRIAQSPDSDGANGELDQPGEPIVWNGKLYITCFDCVTGPDKVNTKHQKPYTITTLELVK